MRELIAFAGPVQCEAAHGAINLVLRGIARATQGPRCGLTEVLFSGASAVALPLELRDARVIEMAAELERRARARARSRRRAAALSHREPGGPAGIAGTQCAAAS